MFVIVIAILMDSLGPLGLWHKHMSIGPFFVEAFVIIVFAWLLKSFVSFAAVMNH